MLFTPTRLIIMSSMALDDPSILFLTGDNDGRVNPFPIPAQMIARLQTAQQIRRIQILLRHDRHHAGHGIGIGTG